MDSTEDMKKSIKIMNKSLLVATRKGDLVAVKSLLSVGAGVNYQGKWERLHICMSYSIRVK